MVRLACAVLYVTVAFLLSIPNDAIRYVQFRQRIFLYDISYNEEYNHDKILEINCYPHWKSSGTNGRKDWFTQVHLDLQNILYIFHSQITETNLRVY